MSKMINITRMMEEKEKSQIRQKWRITEGKISTSYRIRKYGSPHLEILRLMTRWMKAKQILRPARRVATKRSWSQRWTESNKRACASVFISRLTSWSRDFRRITGCSWQRKRDWKSGLTWSVMASIQNSSTRSSRICRSQIRKTNSCNVELTRNTEVNWMRSSLLNLQTMPGSGSRTSSFRSLNNSWCDWPKARLPSTDGSRGPS